jgi:hypothetical protein
VNRGDAKTETDLLVRWFAPLPRAEVQLVLVIPCSVRPSCPFAVLVYAGRSGAARARALLSPEVASLARQVIESVSHPGYGHQLQQSRVQSGVWAHALAPADTL